jgi:hypothetical protein
MTPNAAKLRRRVLTIGANAINTLFLPLLSPIVSLLVVRLVSPDLWGEFVQVAIVAQLGAHVAGWGNKEYLLRRFSQSPSQIARAWRASMLGRVLPFAGFCLVLGILDIPPLRALLIALWCLGMALDQSFDALVAYRRAFVFAAAVDLCGLVVMCGAVASIGPGLTLDTLLGLFAATSLASTCWRAGRGNGSQRLERQSSNPSPRSSRRSGSSRRLKCIT